MFDWKWSKAGNRYFKRGVFLCTVFPNSRGAGYSYVVSNTETGDKKFVNDFEDVDDAVENAEEEFTEITETLSGTVANKLRGGGKNAIDEDIPF